MSSLMQAFLLLVVLSCLIETTVSKSCQAKFVSCERWHPIGSIHSRHACRKRHKFITCLGNACHGKQHGKKQRKAKQRLHQIKKQFKEHCRQG